MTYRQSNICIIFFIISKELHFDLILSLLREAYWIVKGGGSERESFITPTTTTNNKRVEVLLNFGGMNNSKNQKKIRAGVAS
jgi:hypothetical protein